MQTHARPQGPRIPGPRPVSPAPLNLPVTQPLEIRKKVPPSSSLAPNQSPPLPPPSEPSKKPQPTLTLGIPTPRSRANTPRIKLDIPPSSRPEYYDGPVIQPQSSTEHPEEVTIRPQLTTLAMPTSQKPVEPVAEISSVIRDLKINSEGDLDNSGTSGDAAPVDPFTTRKWSDEDLEELARLGEGAGGAVHKMKDRQTGRILARKTITTREAPMRQLIREINFISNTKHVNITQFYGAYISPSSSEVKIVMEYCEGGSLESIGKKIKERHAVVSEKIAGRLAEGILQGLAFLHSKKTIHRDIKPSNILLSRDGVVKLCDFGVSGELIDSMAGTFTGTGIYMAPERITAQEYTIRADVWSTGISLLELAQNRFPFPADLGPIELVMRITKEEPPQLEDGPVVQWSPEMKDFIRQTLIVNQHQRPTPREMLNHPWILWVMSQEVSMARWVAQVWGWSRPSRAKENGSRPSSSRRGNSGDFPTLATNGEVPPKNDNA